MNSEFLIVDTILVTTHGMILKGQESKLFYNQFFYVKSLDSRLKTFDIKKLIIKQVPKAEYFIVRLVCDLRGTLLRVI